MRIFHKIIEIQKYIELLRSKGKKISFVPTMGFLHEGHLSLLKKAKENDHIAIVSIFVNKRQFNNIDDFNNYPINLESDIVRLKENDADILFCPDNDEINLSNYLIDFDIGILANNLCGKYRKGHFEGVIQIINRLFKIIQPDIAIFGEKDFQQLQIIKYFTQKNNLNVRIISSPAFRQENGLVMSSRNSRLSSESLQNAVKVFKSLTLIKRYLLSVKEVNISNFLEENKKKLSKNFDNVEYLQICNEDDLRDVKILDKGQSARIFIAVHLDGVRLIDNIKLF
jgi:pantoate--beta-alanine ligase